MGIKKTAAVIVAALTITSAPSLAHAVEEPAGLWPRTFEAKQTAADCTTKWRLDQNSFCVADDARNGVELGVKFVVSRPTEITGVRLYRADPAALPITLWDGSGNKVARGSLPPGKTNRWEDASFNRPVTAQPGQTYLVSYYSPATKYAFRYEYFLGPVTVGPVTALPSVDSPNGVHCYDVANCTIPNRGYRASTYWVTPLWRALPGEPLQVPGPEGPAPVAGEASDLVAPRVVAMAPRGKAGRSPRIRAKFSEAVLPEAVTARTVRLLHGKKKVRATMTVRSDRVTLRPKGKLRRGTTYRVRISSSVRDLAGNRLDQDRGKPGWQGVTWTFRTR